MQKNAGIIFSHKQYKFNMTTIGKVSCHYLILDTLSYFKMPCRYSNFTDTYVLNSLTNWS